MNVVFDLGGVVFEWQPEKIARRVFDNAATEALVLAQIIGHDDWNELDRGTLSRDDAIARGAARTGLPDKEVARLFDEVPASLAPMDASIDLIRSIRATDNRIYVLSNMHRASIDYLEKHHDIWNLFDGTVISCRVNLVKPEIGIYEHLLNEFGLSAPQTVFIDDTLANLVAAATLGIATIQFENAAQCRRELGRLQCI